MFWNIFNSLCKEKNKTPNYVCKELGFSNATATHWKNGTPPGSKSLDKIANYFNVSIDYLLGHTDEKNAPSVSIEGALLDRLNQLSDLELDELEHFLDYLLYKRSRSSHS